MGSQKFFFVGYNQKDAFAFTAVVIVLQVNGVNVSSVAAGLGIAGTVVDFINAQKITTMH